VPKAHVIAASGDEDRVQAMCNELDWNVDFQRRKGGGIPRQSFTGEYSLAYFRALAKIDGHFRTP
jgi:hypothetical protein